MLEDIFVYWTLMYSDVQQKVIWRSSNGEKDILFWFMKTTIEINWNTYPIIKKDINTNEWIEGLVISVNQDELIKLDEYETSAYIRKKVILDSWKEVWVYQK